MPPLQRVVQRVEADRHAGGEPFPVPDQQRVGEAGHVPRRPVAVPGADAQLDVAGVRERVGAAAAARRPSGLVADGGQPAAQLAASTRCRPAARS